jgi:probable addiction module antidote protein
LTKDYLADKKAKVKEDTEKEPQKKGVKRGAKMRHYLKFHDVIIEDLKNDPDYAKAYLQVALEEFEQDGDSEHFMVALRNVAEAQGGVPELARRLNKGKTSLYKALSEKGNPRLETIGAILNGLGYRLTLEPIAQRR